MNGQDRNFKKGKKLYDVFYYSQAVPFLEKSYHKNKDTLSLHYLAYALVKSKQYDRAIPYFKELASNKQALPEYYMDYGKLLKNNGQYAEARSWFIQYLRKNPNSMEIRMLLRSCDLSSDLLRNKLGISAVSWDKNSAQIDFAPTLLQNQLIFSSNRPLRLYDTETYGWDDMPFLNLWQSESFGNNEPNPFSKKLELPYHVGPCTFKADGAEIIFTANQMNGKKLILDSSGTNRLELLVSVKENNNWTNPQKLEFNSNEYSTGHPSLSADGNILYFASDMPGGFGGSDIWMCNRTASGWTKPRNMGAEINSAGNEFFPSIQGDTLWFSSDFWPGLGGLDIFFSVKNNRGWSQPVNPGAPFNSNRDDHGIAFVPNSNTGFFSSDRLGGKGADDIYRFKQIKICLQAAALDSSTYQMMQGVIMRVNNGKDFSQEEITDANGKAGLCLPVENEFVISFEKPGYKPVRVPFNTNGFTQDTDTNILVELVKGSSFLFAGYVKDYSTKQPIQKASVVILNSKGEKDLLNTDKQGYFDLSLEPGKTYTLQASKDGYLVHEESFKMPNQNGEKTVYLDKIILNGKLNIRNIYYDLDKSDIRPDAAKTLDTLANLMKNNPYLQVEMGSHTDSRADDLYNEQLSLRRATSVINYLAAKGIEPYRISYKYYGETQLITPCPDGVYCSEEDHQMNRRTEFKILAY